MRWLSVPTAQAAGWDANQGAFDAYWQMGGPVHVLEYADGTRVGAGRLTGNLRVQSNTGGIPIFETNCIALSDETGSTGRCVWTDAVGDLVYA